MKTIITKLLLTFILLISVILPNISSAQSIALIPESEQSNEDIWNVINEIAEWWKVWDNYNETLKSGDLSLSDQFKTWVMNRDTILDYVSYLAKFLWQLALLVAAIAIIIVWYQKAIAAFGDGGTSSPIIKVVAWLLVIIFAYFIIKLIYSAFIW